MTGRLRNFDFILCLTAIIIFGIGLLFLYSATYQYRLSDRLSGTLSTNFLLRQIVWFLLSLLIGALIVKVDYMKWLDLAYPLYIANLVLLFLVLFLGESRFGAQRWIDLGKLSFQPSEFSKIVIILTLARYLGQRKNAAGDGLSWLPSLESGKALAVAFLLVGVPFILIVKQPDLGTAITLIPVLLAILFIWGTSLWTLCLIFGSGLLLSPLLWHGLKDYQKRRILVFLNPDMDPLGAGYSIIQSKISIGSGRLFGKGWLAGTQNQLNFLPERHTDFIFSVVAEEWGFLGVLFLLILYLILIWRAFTILQHAKTLPAKLIAGGAITILSFQILVNISMTMGLVPVVGLPLPFISYGGSSLLTTVISLAFLLNIGRHKNIC